MARTPPLTWILVGVVLFVGVMMLVYTPCTNGSCWGIYNGILESNYLYSQKGIDPAYANIYTNLTSDQESLTGLSQDVSSTKSLWSIFTNTGAGVVNTLAIGLTSISYLAGISTYISHFNAILSETFHFPPAIFWMITTIATIIIATALIRAARGTINEA